MMRATERFPDQIKGALAATSESERWQQLQALAALELDFVQTLQLDKALQRAASGVRAPVPKCRVALLSSCTVDHLVSAIRVAGLGRGLWIEVFRGEYAQYRQELLQPPAALTAFEPEYLLLSLSAREILASIPVASPDTDVAARIRDEIDQLKGLWQRARTAFGAVVIQQSYLDVSTPLFGNLDRQIPAAPARIIHELNHALLRAVNEEAVLLLDVAAASSRQGIDHWFDINRWLQGKYEIAPQAAGAYGQLVGQVLGAQKGLSRKCLVFDLDNTLWGGVIGDDGLEGIVLGEGDARGEAHLHLQRYAKQMKERGVILAVCSKNDESNARSAFDSHPEMLLRADDIAAFVANWDDKSANLVRIAEQLNIGLDSLVFVDDNPAERARIRESLPQVAVPELPEDPAGYVQAIAHAGYFEAASFTPEDVERAAQYAANARRNSLQSSVQSMDEFLSGLDMTMTFGRVSQAELPRAVQLINKTNQFNTTGRRFTSEEVTSYLADNLGEVLYFRLSDRFGDNGLVSVVLGSLSADVKTFHLDTWVMSCRVFGRQFEHEIMNVLFEIARARGVDQIQAEFVPTAKNGVIGGLFEMLGFNAEEQTEDGRQRWHLPLDEFIRLETHIARGDRN